MIIQQFSVPYTGEVHMLGTACSTSLLSSHYFPTTGVARGLQANQALISCHGTNLRYRISGGTVATNCGHVLVAGDYLSLNDVAQMQNLQLLNEGQVATAVIAVTYFVG